jgi:hypothetical protein
MAPYRGVRYYLKEVQQANLKPKNAKELFNLQHSSLWNVIERIFGVLKRQWKILGGKGCEYSIDTQIDLFCALVGLYNFGKQCGEDESFLNESFDDIVIEESQGEITEAIGNKGIDKRRDDITEKMWSDYQLYIQR